MRREDDVGGRATGNQRCVIIRPHHSTTYVDAAYCYRRTNVVCLSVCLLVGLSRS